MKKKSLLTLALSLSLVAVVSVGSTLAYLSTKTDVVTNTFTVGSYAENALKLDEARVSYENGDWVEDEELTSTNGRTTGQTYTDLLPGSDVFKDPSVQLAKGINSYVFVHIVGVDDLEKKGMKLDRTTDSLGDDWFKLTADGSRDELWNKDAGLVDGYYVYKSPVTELTIADGQLFDGLYIETDVSEADIAQINNKQIKIKAAAVQADSIEGDTPEKTAFETARSGLDF